MRLAAALSEKYIMQATDFVELLPEEILWRILLINFSEMQALKMEITLNDDKLPFCMATLLSSTRLT